MPARRLTHPDRDLVAAALSPPELAMLEAWADVLGLTSWWAMGGVPQVVTIVAAVRLVDRLKLEAVERGEKLADGEAMRRAAEGLGLQDDVKLGTHPGDSLARQLRRWIESARGHDVRAPGDEAA